MTGFFQSNRTPCLAKAPKPVFRATSVVGRGGLEPPTSRLSGVRSNHLSYRPLYRHKPPKGRFSAYRPAQLSPQFRCRSEEHTSELQSLMRISYAVFCLKKKTK